MYKVAVNGFGRIGQTFLRQTLKHESFYKNCEIVALNASYPPEMIAYMLKYDCVHGTLDVEVEAKEKSIVVDGHEIVLTAERDPAKLPWNDYGVDLVVEGTGAFRKREDAAKHLTAGAKKVLVTAPGKGVDSSIVLGVNEDDYSPEHEVVDAASCTTNCLAPTCKALHDAFEIKRGFMTTIHAYTNDQKILDSPHHKDARRGRAAATCMLPTSTGAAKAVANVLPALKGRLDGLAVRVPVPDGSLVDLTVELGESVTEKKVNEAFKAFAKQKPDIMGYCADPIVSTDVISDPHSCVIDSLETRVLGEEGSLVKVLAWYDNEAGYSMRLVDLVELMREKG